MSPQLLKRKLDRPIVGFSGGAARGGEPLPVLIKGFLTSDEGDTFYKVMRSIYRSFIDPFQNELKNAGKSPDGLSHFLIRQQLDGQYEIIIDDIQIHGELLAKTNIEKGDPVSLSQIADIRRIVLPNIKFSERETVLFFFTSYWRHGLYFDFGCVNDENYRLVLDDFGANLAQCFLAVWFPTVYRNDDITTRLKHNGWFPFIALAGELFENLYGVFERGEAPEGKEWVITDKIDAEWLRNQTTRWYLKVPIAERKEFFDNAIGRFEAGDNLSCIKTLYSEIEGVLRQLYLPQSSRPNVPNLIGRLNVEVESHAPGWSLFRYDEFANYLTDWFFKGFNYSTGDVELSRHSTSHGVAASSEYSKRNAVIGFLILDQIAFYLRA